MARKVILSDLAVQHLEETAAFISADSREYAAYSVSQIISRLEQVADFPMSGRVVPEFRDPSLREVFWRHYRILYEFDEQTVFVLAVYHGKRQLPERI
jgi:plasmid stabilization system protein ParE